MHLESATMAEKLFTDKDYLLEQMHDLFKHIPPLQHQQVLESMSLYRFKKDDLIFVEGSACNESMYLIDGIVKVYQSGIADRDQILRIIGSGEIFGYEASLIGNTIHSTRAAAMDNSLICFFPMETMMELANSNLAVANTYITSLARSIAHSDMMTINLTQNHVRGRLAKALLVVSSQRGAQEDDGKTIRYRISRKDLADIGNMTTNNAIRTLSSFADEGIVELIGRKIKILDFDKLTDISNIE